MKLNCCDKCTSTYYCSQNSCKNGTLQLFLEYKVLFKVMFYKQRSIFKCKIMMVRHLCQKVLHSNSSVAVDLINVVAFLVSWKMTRCNISTFQNEIMLRVYIDQSMVSHYKQLLLEVYIVRFCVLYHKVYWQALRVFASDYRYRE